MTRVLPNFFYDVKYAVGGVEKDVDACFVEKTTLVSLFALCIIGACLVVVALLSCDTNQLLLGGMVCVVLFGEGRKPKSSTWK